MKIFWHTYVSVALIASIILTTMGKIDYAILFLCWGIFGVLMANKVDE